MGPAMDQAYRSFLIRVRRLRGGEVRVAVEHIQTGERLTGVGLETALAWLSARATAAALAPPATPATGDEPGEAPDQTR